MPQFRGSKNLHIGSPAWASSKYDPETQEYVIDLSASDAKKFRPIAEAYGFAEVGGSSDKKSDED